jgi:putative oxygen-independent coproporphyrinogen III oxidase
MVLQLPPLSLYVHLPWCVRKCPYCDFNSHVQPRHMPEEAYITALIADFEHDAHWLQGRKITTIFFGGGTPSLFSGTALGRVLDHLRNKNYLADAAEITLEANPGTVDSQHFADYVQIGINRLSIGIQSFDNQALQRLGRIHDGDAARQAITLAHQVGFRNINLDLMHGLPEQTWDMALQDLVTAIDFSPSHISWYQLTLEPNTVFAKQPPILPDLDIRDAIYFAGRSWLAEHGWQQYEVSAYCQPNQMCQHNLNYWQFGDYLGIGAGAHGKITDLNTQQITRYNKIKHPTSYLTATQEINGSVMAEQRICANNDLPFEFMLNAMRLFTPIPFTLFSQRTGLEIARVMPILQLAEQREFLILSQHDFALTAHGKNFVNDIIELFLSS